MSVIGQQIIEAVRAHAAAKSDFKYTPIPFSGDPEDGSSCVYVAEGCPSCLIGQALWDTGLIDESIEGTDANMQPFSFYNTTLFPVIENLSNEEINWLNKVQRGQDSGYSWGYAVSQADALVGTP